MPANSAPNEDHHCAAAAVIRKSPSDWKRPTGRPNHMAHSHWIRSETTEHRSFLRLEEGSLSRTLAFTVITGYTQEEHAMYREVC